MTEKPFLILDFTKERDFYSQFNEIPNFGDGDQTDFLHPAFQFLKEQTEDKSKLKLAVTAARIIYGLDDDMGCEWHLDRENEFDSDTDYTLLLYCNDMTQENGGLLEFKSEILLPKNGLGVLINNRSNDSIHRATPMKIKRPRKLFKMTFQLVNGLL